MEAKQSEPLKPALSQEDSQQKLATQPALDLSPLRKEPPSPTKEELKKEEATIEKLTTGLKSLYVTLLKKEGVIPADSQEEEKALKELIPSQASIGELFQKRHDEWKQKRIKANEKCGLLRLPRVVMLKYLLPFYDLNEICKLTEVCVCFNSMIKSTIFLHYYVSLHEKTGVSINIGMEPVSHSAKKPKSAADPLVDDKSALEDSEARLAMLSQTKDFLAAQLKESQETVKSLKKEIQSLRAMVTNEKGTKLKVQGRIAQLEDEIDDCNRKGQLSEVMQENKIAENEREISEKEQEIDKLNKKACRLRQLESKLGEKNRKLQEKLRELQEKDEKKTNALKTLCDHFFLVTYPNLETLFNKTIPKEEQSNSRIEDIAIIKSLEPPPAKEEKSK